ncbi:hypothetical protein [Devosia sp. 1566]|jgi:phosphotransferase system  glucose/maltose/N-acetylglucosamine-specific IIC component|uniref:hypothetical protein n=1 Tax=Devosia sp. 1566 TaxID=2499144 RepID=UPI000FD8219C|nr:hypothetical protein [Devosia sp. 1566]
MPVRKLNSSQWVLAIFIGLAVITVAATVFTNLVQWRNYDTIEAEQNIAPEDAIPLQKGFTEPAPAPAN